MDRLPAAACGRQGGLHACALHDTAVDRHTAALGCWHADITTIPCLSTPRCSAGWCANVRQEVCVGGMRHAPAQQQHMAGRQPHTEGGGQAGGQQQWQREALGRVSERTRACGTFLLGQQGQLHTPQWHVQGLLAVMEGVQHSRKCRRQSAARPEPPHRADACCCGLHLPSAVCRLSPAGVSRWRS